MIQKSIAAPDVKLMMDSYGIIQEASLSDTFAGEHPDDWVGLPWTDTVRPSDGIHLKHMLEDARSLGVSAFRQVVQRLPSGAEAHIEYTTIQLGKDHGLLAVGKNLRAVTELQNRLVEAQQALERDYWKLREVETRYRLLFNSSNEAVVILDARGLSVLELNPAAAQALGLPTPKPRSTGTGKFLETLLVEDRETFANMLRQVRERGKAPGILLRLGEDRQPWLARASLMSSAANEIFLVQLSPSGMPTTLYQGGTQTIPTEDLLERGPDAFVVIDDQGAILRANRAFLDMVQMGSETSLLGKPLGRWLGRPGADLTVLLANVLRLGAVRLFSTTLHGEHGTEVEVEISANGNTATSPAYIGVFLRDIGRRLSTEGQAGGVAQWLDFLTKQVGKTTLRKLVDDTVEVVERHYILAALELAGSNRTVAAELLGLSRQSLYVKLNRYGLEDEKAESKR
ncbi:MAG: transcriptional regulator PpsR [Chromatiaceae bacterium]